MPFDDVTPLQRSNAKGGKTSVLYTGIGSYSLSQDIGITKKRGLTNTLTGYFAKYPKVKEFVDNCVETARENWICYNNI